MAQFINDNLALVAVVLLVAAVVAFLLLRPRQRVRLSADSAPLRPHMAHHKKPESEGHGLAAEAAAAACDVAGEIFHAPVHDQLPAAAGPPDDFTRLKGVGPKVAELLQARGLSRFEQLAHLTPQEVELLDNALGAFRGRLTRDRVVEQAAYLARGDVDGFEARFGKL